MEFRYIFKKCIGNFLMVQAWITLAIGVLGCIKPPPGGIDHRLFFMPFVYAFFCIFPSLIVYSRKELSIKQMAVRKVIQFLLIELIVILISYLAGAIDDVFMRAAIIVAVAVIYITVSVFSYLISRSDAEAMTRKIQRMKGEKDGKQCGR